MKKIGYFKNYPQTSYGIVWEKRLNIGYIKSQWILVLYYGKKYRAFSNQPIYENG